MPRSLPQAPKGGSRSTAEIGVQDGSAPVVATHRPIVALAELNSNIRMHTYLGVARVCIEDVGEELACAGYPRNY